MKTLVDTELRILLTIIHKTIGQVDPDNPKKRKRRAWISQKLFCICTGKTNRSVSYAIDSLVTSKLILVTNVHGEVMNTKALRRGAHRLYYESCLQLSSYSENASELSSHNPVNTVHTIKLNSIKQSSEESTQGVTRITDLERLKELGHVHRL